MAADTSVSKHSTVYFNSIGNPVLRPLFECPICEHDSHCEVWIKDKQGSERRTGAVQCRECTVMFRDPDRFTARRYMIKQAEG